MPKVICKLPNASEKISGVNFTQHPDGAEFGMVSEEISQDQADVFASIPGYELVGAPDKELVDLRAQAEALGIKVDQRWKPARLRQEIKAVQDDPSAKAATPAPAPASAPGAGEQASQPPTT